MTGRKTATKKPSAAPQGMASEPVVVETQWKWHLGVIGVAILLIAIAYANATGGSFVYDDESQIAKNPDIQTGGDLGQALFTVVWAFRSVAGEARSNYCRPVFIAWVAVNYRLFGLQPT